MRVVFADKQKKHNPELFFASGTMAPNPEVPERADRLFAAAKSARLIPERPKDFGLGPVAAVHTQRYLHYFEEIYKRWSRIPGGSDEVVPGIQPGARTGGYPRSAAGQAGWHHSDTASPIGKNTWSSALWSANTAVHAAQMMLDGEQSCYALCRPPGHHASSEVAGGFCYLNNVAIAAQHLRSQHERIAILDVDVHHGNGTQEIFYARSDVLTISIHADPVRFYPFFWGYSEEMGEGDGLGYNLNLPMERGTKDDEFLQMLSKALERIATFQPGVLVVALGLDAHESDPFQGFAVTTDGFRRIGEHIGAANLPTLIVQEGGYLSDALGPNLAAVLNGFKNLHGIKS